jgi:predicted DNA-binding antitoxin AbrB/MazE fold protein
MPYVFTRLGHEYAESRVISTVRQLGNTAHVAHVDRRVDPRERLTPPQSAKLKDMAMTFEAVYENGVLRPLESLALPNLQHVLVTIASAPATADDVAGYFEPEEWEAAKHDDIILQEVRRALSSIPGSLADAAIASREER